MPKMHNFMLARLRMPKMLNFRARAHASEVADGYASEANMPMLARLLMATLARLTMLILAMLTMPMPTLMLARLTCPCPG